MLVFDVHTHIFPDAIAARTVDKLGEKAGISPFYDGTRKGLQASMATAGIDGALNCPIATRPDQVDSIIDWAARNNYWPILSLGSIHPDSPEPDRALTRLKKAGLPGIKLHPEYQQFTLDDPRMSRIWQACRDLDLLIMLHAGADIAFSPPFRTDPVAIVRLIEQYPGLKLIAAHFGSWRMWEQVAQVMAGASVWIDTSFTMGLLDDQQLITLIRRHGAERVLFGTDTPWRSQKQDLQHFYSLELSEKEKRMILWQNAECLLNLSLTEDKSATDEQPSPAITETFAAGAPK